MFDENNLIQISEGAGELNSLSIIKEGSTETSFTVTVTTEGVPGVSAIAGMTVVHDVYITKYI